MSHENVALVDRDPPVAWWKKALILYLITVGSAVAAIQRQQNYSHSHPALPPTSEVDLHFGTIKNLLLPFDQYLRTGDFDKLNMTLYGEHKPKIDQILNKIIAIEGTSEDIEKFKQLPDLTKLQKLGFQIPPTQTGKRYRDKPVLKVGNAIQKQSYELIALRLRASQGCVYSSLKLAEDKGDDGLNIAMANQARAQATKKEKAFVEAELNKLFKKSNTEATFKSSSTFNYGYLISMVAGLFMAIAAYFYFRMPTPVKKPRISLPVQTKPAKAPQAKMAKGDVVREERREVRYKPG
ncbi:MAG TPA: hypothetical protein VGV92_01555 [Gammaproteobacteria bacterium]|nr:hypothetical protein [Gammaproteobacteria bacterium]